MLSHETNSTRRMNMADANKMDFDLSLVAEREPDLIAITNRLENHLADIRDGSLRLSDHADRLFGPVDQACGEECSPYRCGLIGRIEGLLDDITEAQNELYRQIARNTGLA